MKTPPGGRALCQIDAVALSRQLVDPSEAVQVDDGWIVIEARENGLCRVWCENGAFSYPSRQAFEQGDDWGRFTGMGNIVFSRS